MKPEAHDDFVDIARCLTDEGCDFVVVGAHALAAHGVSRATGDLDILVRPEGENALRVVRALQHFGAPLATHGVSARDFERPGTVYQLGLPPRRIDILTELSGVSYDDAAAQTVDGHLADVRVRCIGFDALLRNKRATGRAKDLADVEALEEIRQRSR